MSFQFTECIYNIKYIMYLLFKVLKSNLSRLDKSEVTKILLFKFKVRYIENFIKLLKLIPNCRQNYLHLVNDQMLTLRWSSLPHTAEKY